jgi:uncharacterized protein YbaP (TraB family)
MENFVQEARMNKRHRFSGVPAALLLSVLILLAGCAGQKTVQEPGQAAAPAREPIQEKAPAETPAPEQATPPTAAARDTISLWKVSSGGNTVYLLGSLHLLTPEDYPLDERFEEAYERVDTVVFETDLDALESPDVLGLTRDRVMYDDGRTLDEVLPADLYAALAEHCGRIGLSVDQFKSFRPWFVSMTLTTLHIMLMGYNPYLGIDQHFYDQAKADGKDIGALEAPEYQIGLLTSFSELDQEALLRETLLELEQLDLNMAEIHAAWQTGDLEAMDLLNQSMREFPTIYKTLVTDRNTAWVERIAEYLEQDKDILVIVGAAHMAGSDGLIELLCTRELRVGRY